MIPTKLAEAFVEIKADSKQLTTGLNKAQSQVGKSVDKISLKLAKIGKVMTVAGVAITAAFALTVKSAMSFEKELAQVSTMLNKTTMSYMPKYKTALQKLSVQFGEATSTLSKGLYDILSASIDPAKALDVLAIAAKAASAGITDTGVAADAITTILNSYGFEAEEAGRISDQLFAIVKRGKTTFEELAPAIGKSASLAAQSGLSFEELGASIATMTRAGIRTDEAMTAVNGILRSFLKPVEGAKEAAKELGIEFSTNTLRTEGLVEVLAKLKDATEQQLAAMFPNIRGLKGIAAALQNATGFAEDYKLMLNSAGLTEEAFQKQSDTLAFKLEQLKQAVNVVAVTIGDVLIPSLKTLTEWAVKIAGKIKEWADANKPLVDMLVKITAGVGALMLVLGPLFMMLPGLVLAFTGLSIALKAIPGLATKAAAGINTLGGAFLVGAANIIIWSEAWKEWKDLTEMLKDSTTDITSANKILATMQEKVAKKLGISVDTLKEFLKTGEKAPTMMERYADALDVWTIAAIEQQVNAKLIITTVKDLAQEMSLLSNEYEASNQAISETLTYYDSMIDLLNRTDVILQTELMLLEKGTDAWHEKKEEIANNTKALKDINAELAKLTEPLEGLELITAKMASLGESTEDTKKKIELLKEKAILLQKALDEAIPDTAAWWEAKNAFDGNQIAIDGLTTKLAELTEEEKEAIEAAKTLADAYKEIADSIYELTHTPLETAIRKLDEQKQAYIDLGVEIGIVNEWYDEQIKKLEADLNPALDKATKKVKEAGGAAKDAGILGGKGWDELTASIKRATNQLSNFTKEGLAAMIATIKMKFYPILQDLYASLETAGSYAFMVQAQINNVLKMQAEQIATATFGLDAYNNALASIGGTANKVADALSNIGWGGTAPPPTPAGVTPETGTGTGGGWGSYQLGTPYVPQTGLYQLHKGEAVIPANQNTYNNTNTQNNTINIPSEGGNVQLIAKAVEDVLYDMGRQFKRRGFEIIPGRG